MSAGYFEETKIPRIRPNDKVEIRLMGVSTPLEGHVESIDRAIADREIALNPTFQIVDVNPTFSWVRLAQRIPVRIAIDKVPDGVLLASGMTATVEVLPAEEDGGEVGEAGRTVIPRRQSPDFDISGLLTTPVSSSRTPP